MQRKTENLRVMRAVQGTNLRQTNLVRRKAAMRRRKTHEKFAHGKTFLRPCACCSSGTCSGSSAPSTGDSTSTTARHLPSKRRKPSPKRCNWALSKSAAGSTPWHCRRRVDEPRVEAGAVLDRRAHHRNGLVGEHRRPAVRHLADEVAAEVVERGKGGVDDLERAYDLAEHTFQPGDVFRENIRTTLEAVQPKKFKNIETGDPQEVSSMEPQGSGRAAVAMNS